MVYMPGETINGDHLVMLFNFCHWPVEIGPNQFSLSGVNTAYWWIREYACMVRHFWISFNAERKVFAFPTTLVNGSMTYSSVSIVVTGWIHHFGAGSPLLETMDPPRLGLPYGIWHHSLGQILPTGSHQLHGTMTNQFAPNPFCVCRKFSAKWWIHLSTIFIWQPWIFG